MPGQVVDDDSDGSTVEPLSHAQERHANKLKVLLGKAARIVSAPKGQPSEIVAPVEPESHRIRAGDPGRSGGRPSRATGGEMADYLYRNRVSYLVHLGLVAAVRYVLVLTVFLAWRGPTDGVALMIGIVYGLLELALLRARGAEAQNAINIARVDEFLTHTQGAAKGGIS